MKQVLGTFALLLVTAAAPASASSKQSIEGRWTNPKRSVVVDIARCGEAYCGRVVSASPKAKENARKGGTPNLIGKQILTGLKPAGDSTYKGRAFVPKHNVHASATVRQVNSDVMVVKGCAVAGMLCDEVRWTRAR